MSVDVMLLFRRWLISLKDSVTEVQRLLRRGFLIFFSYESQAVKSRPHFKFCILYQALVPVENFLYGVNIIRCKQKQIWALSLVRRLHKFQYVSGLNNYIFEFYIFHEQTLRATL